jgi:hypothetical protein
MAASNKPEKRVPGTRRTCGSCGRTRPRASFRGRSGICRRCQDADAHHQADEADGDAG